MSMVRKVELGHLLLAWSLILYAPATFAANPIVVGLDAGGGRATSTTYTVDSSIGIISGSLMLGGVYSNMGGFPGELVDPSALTVLSTPSMIGGSSTSQLGGVVTLTDGTATLLKGIDMAWSLASYPIASISTSGVAESFVVPSNTIGKFVGSYCGAYATNTLLIYAPAMLTLAVSPPGAAKVIGEGAYVVGANVSFSAVPSNGWQFLCWNDGLQNNPRSVIMSENGASYTAILGSPSNIAVALEATNVNWTLGGNASWFSQTSQQHGTASAAQSGALGAGQFSYIQVVTNGPGSLSFWWKVSSATGNCLQFYIGTQLVNQISGNVDWNQYFTYLGTSNTVTLTWVYSKNSSAISGRDAGWVDQVTWKPCPYATNVPQLFFQEPGGLLASWVLNSTGGFEFARILANTSGWGLKAVGDIDGDGVSDLLFQDSSGNTGGWFMTADGSTRNSCFWWNIGGWEIKACGDFEGLGRGQIFFQTTRGDSAYWRVDTNGAFQAAVALGNMGAWKLRGIGDIDGDHKAELFFQNAAGQVAIWYHNPDNSIRAALPFNTGEWALSGVVDVDNDGVCDLIWQTPDTRTGGWFMQTNGTARSASFWWPTGGWKLKAAGR